MIRLGIVNRIKNNFLVGMIISIFSLNTNKCHYVAFLFSGVMTSALHVRGVNELAGLSPPPPPKEKTTDSASWIAVAPYMSMHIAQTVGINKYINGIGM